MKRSLQAILIAGEEMRDEVLSGKKVITIREGHRDYMHGPVLIGCHLLNWATMKEIVAVDHTTLGEVTKEIYQQDGFETKSELLEGLSKFYPNINWDSAVTIVGWE